MRRLTAGAGRDRNEDRSNGNGLSHLIPAAAFTAFQVFTRCCVRRSGLSSIRQLLATNVVTRW
jgi:hypothetical protein